MNFLTYPLPTNGSDVSDFYQHFYGGRARDIFVTKQGFMRFFDVSEEYLDNCPLNVKIFDESHGHCEMIGYKLKYFDDSKTLYRITFINYNVQTQGAHNHA